MLSPFSHTADNTKFPPSTMKIQQQYTLTAVTIYFQRLLQHSITESWLQFRRKNYDLCHAILTQQFNSTAGSRKYLVRCERIKGTISYCAMCVCAAHLTDSGVPPFCYARLRRRANGVGRVEIQDCRGNRAWVCLSSIR